MWDTRGFQLCTKRISCKTNAHSTDVNTCLYSQCMYKMYRCTTPTSGAIDAYFYLGDLTLPLKVSNVTLELIYLFRNSDLQGVIMANGHNFGYLPHVATVKLCTFGLDLNMMLE